MSTYEALAGRVGESLVRATVKRWAADQELVANRQAGLQQLLRLAGLDVRDARRVERQLADIGDRIAELLEPQVASALVGGLADGVVDDVIGAAASAIDQAFTTPAVALARDVDGTGLPGLLDPWLPDAEEGRGPALTRDVVVAGARYAFEMADALPEFETVAAARLLARERGLHDTLAAVLDQYGGDDDEEATTPAFEARYRQLTVRAFQRIRLFGLPTVRRDIKRYPLSVAYISLGAGMLGTGPSRAQESSYTELLAVEDALAASRRILVRGEAGSGKTTLVQWLAVNAANGSLPPALADLAAAFPFVIRLRRYVDEPLPAPSRFASEFDDILGDRMPEGWVEARLDASDGAVVLIDGIDELPVERRGDVEGWLDLMVDTYPTARWVLTSRPSAIDEGFELPDGFVHLELMPMTLAGIEEFIVHWHDAVAMTQIADEQDDFLRLAPALIALVRDEPPLRLLATNPLLCAVLCALHADEKASLPRHRIGLYRTALAALLFRRDAERGVRDHVGLSEDQVYLLLSDLAWWMITNNLSEVAGDVMRDRLGHTLKRMQDAPSAEAVLDHFVARTGLIAEPVIDRYEFIHKTFLEFLAAQKAAAGQEVGVVLDNADRDDWEEVVKLTIGLASPETRATLVRSLIARSDGDEVRSPRLLLLAAAGAATAPELDEQLRGELEERVAGLVPPRTASRAQALSKAGEMALAALDNAKGLSPSEAALTVRTLRLIGGPEAFVKIRAFASDRRPEVLNELIAGINDFDPAEYAQQVLADSPLDHGRLDVHDGSDLSYVHALRHLRALTVAVAAGRRLDKAGLSRARSLVSLTINGAGDLRSVEELGRHRGLAELVLAGGKELADLGGVEHFRLRSLALADLPALESVAQLPSIRKTLQALKLVRTSAWDLGPLRHLDALEDLSVSSQAVESFEFVEDLPSLTRVRLEGLQGAVGLSWLALATGLRELEVVDCDDLEFATFENVGPISLVVRRCPAFDGRALSAVGGLRRLSISGMAKTAVHLQDVGVEEVELVDCRRLRSLDGLKGNVMVRRVELRGCAVLEDLSALGSCPNLEVVSLDQDAQASDARRALAGLSAVRVERIAP